MALRPSVEVLKGTLGIAWKSLIQIKWHFEAQLTAWGVGVVQVRAGIALLWFVTVALCGVGAEPAARDAIVVVHDADLSATSLHALGVFVSRLREAGHRDVSSITDTAAKRMDDSTAQNVQFVVLAGESGSKSMAGLGISSAIDTEGYYLEVGDNRGWTAQKFSRAEHTAIVCGGDSRGLLFGLGKLLRMADSGSAGFNPPPATVLTAPAVPERVVYFATHFNNFYECAPIDELVRYVEDLALWGANGVWTWFDMAWYPENFWDDPAGKGSQMLDRIRAVNEKSRELGLSVGLIAIANEGFKNQPPAELLADASDKRGGYYPDSTICPSKPGGIEMILENKRAILERIGPIDVFVSWPFDQGSCGCPECRPWARTFLKISEQIAVEVERQNPAARFLVSSWYFNEVEMDWLLAAMAEGAPWFDGVLTNTSWPSKLVPPSDYTRMVFPDISMEGSLFVGYGASGANPMPQKYLEAAKAAVSNGYGAALYSEGIYEDFNKVLWVCALWNPVRTAEDIAAEYARFYFGPDNEHDGASLILGLERTWPQEALLEKEPELVRQLHEQAQRVGAKLPPAYAGLVRWQYLMDRAEMDKRLMEIGSDTELLREVKRVFTELGYAGDLVALRAKVQDLHKGAAARNDAIESLFHFHWEYLTRAHLDRSTLLIATPPKFVGQRDWDLLETLLGRALQEEDGESMRTKALQGFRQWFWHNNITLEYVFL
jgi:hypothetical protein